jgi:DNA ligase (NAD+)
MRFLHRIKKWVKILNIMEVGDKLLEDLFAGKVVSDIHDLYRLNEETLSPYFLEAEALSKKKTSKGAAKVLRNVRAKRAVPLSVFIAGFDFEGVGELVMEKVSGAGFNTLEKLRTASEEDLAGVYGIGEVLAKTIKAGLAECKDEIDKVLAAGVVSIETPVDTSGLPLAGKSFCFTGELHTMKRAEAEAKVKALGASAKSSVVKDLSYLVTNNPGSGSAKNKKAQAQGTAVIDEDEFLRIISLSGNPRESELF